MAVVINAKGTSASTFRLGKSGNYLGTDGGEGLFASTDGNIANLATIKIATPVDADDAATQQYVADQIALTDNVISQLNTNITITDAGTGAISHVVDGVTQYTITNGLFDLSPNTQLSAGLGTATSPALAFEGLGTGDEAGLWFDLSGGPESQDQVAIAVDGFTMQKWRVADGASSPVSFEYEMSDSEAKINVVGSATNINIKMAPKGSGLITAPTGYDMSGGADEAIATKGYVDSRLSQTQNKTSAYVTTLSDDVIFTNSSGGVVTITLGTAATVAGKQQMIKDAGGLAGTNTITIATEASQTIDGQATQTITNNFESITIMSDGTNWFMV